MQYSRLTASLLALSTVLFASPALMPPTGNVLVVDGGGSGTFLTIQSAVEAAIDGDVILVRTGTYGSFRITNKALAVVADTGAHVDVQGSIRLRGLAPEKTVVLAGMRAVGAYSLEENLSAGLFLADNQGHVRVQDCVFTGGFFGPAGAVIHASGDVAIGASNFFGGGHGVEASSPSTITIHDSTLQGQDGSPPQMCGNDGSSGWDGARVSGTVLFSSNSHFRGGLGGEIPLGGCMNSPVGGRGGNGVYATASFVRLLASVTFGAPGGPVLPPPSPCGGQCGSTGYAGYDRLGGSFSDIPGTARSLAAPSVVRFTEIVTFRGQPGDRVGLFIADNTSSAQFIPAWHGVLLVPLRAPPAATRALLVGVVPANGVLYVPLGAPALQPGTGSRTLFLQALFTDVQGQRFLSGVRSMTVLP